MSKPAWEYAPFVARFQPQRTDDLAEGLKRWIGYEGEWERQWLISEEDGGDYVGQFAVAPSRDEVHRAWQRGDDPPLYPRVWAPECDFEKPQGSEEAR